MLKKIITVAGLLLFFASCSTTVAMHQTMSKHDSIVSAIINKNFVLLKKYFEAGFFADENVVGSKRKRSYDYIELALQNRCSENILELLVTAGVEVHESVLEELGGTERIVSLLGVLNKCCVPLSKQLCQNLLLNALHYEKEDTMPMVKLLCERGIQVKDCYHSISLNNRLTAFSILGRDYKIDYALFTLLLKNILLATDQDFLGRNLRDVLPRKSSRSNTELMRNVLTLLEKYEENKIAPEKMFNKTTKDACLATEIIIARLIGQAKRMNYDNTVLHKVSALFNHFKLSGKTDILKKALDQNNLTQEFCTIEKDYVVHNNLLAFDGGSKDLKLFYK